LAVPPKISILPLVSTSLSELTSQTGTEQATIVHCTLKRPLLIRMWPSTFLIQENGNRKKLLHVHNIEYYPKWKNAPAGYQFSLLFEGLDRDCKSFDLLEEAAESGGFIVQNIQRNHSDVYRVAIDSENLQA
jgi:hypothetical protein